MGIGIGMQEMLIILVVGLVVFGSGRLPEISSSLGRAIHNFKKATVEPDEIDITPQGLIAGDKISGRRQKRLAPLERPRLLHQTILLPV